MTATTPERKPSMGDRVRAAVAANKAAAPPPRGRVHSEWGAPVGEVPPEVRAAKKRASAERRERRAKAQAERHRPILAPAVNLHPLLQARKASWTSLPVGRDRDPVVLPLDIDPALLGTSAIARVAEPPAAINVQHPRVPAAYTAEDILARLASVSTEVILAPDGRLAVKGPAGRVSAEAAYIIGTHAEMIRAHLAGLKLSCSWCNEPARVVLVGGALACEKHWPEP